ncbi:molybdate ABC transporter substrate-binding protein [Robertmurraya kyonggiensis]|uniref:Molybdate ABC transporter substrate-binding protein n=1 Tax=Robertmurraya kyonggiensis TaxID=1037680 RepID=A0A4U1D3A3_9BACI|nr:molybdate ABC transporter substrate-binding protein [Robertmurraya kyonggiensis]TKC16791.1 molybdate ABC transporter substrate-binding protein [Robertmurraya kyonggiensis]
MKRIVSLFMTVLVLAFIMTACSNNGQSNAKKEAVELTISAAASLQDALTEITTNFNKKYPDIKINYNFGASGALQQQISQGAPVDLFFSAAEDKFYKVVDEGLIKTDQSIDLVGNEIVLIVPEDSNQEINAFEDLVNADKISIGTPESVPAGKYAQETLTNSNLWNDFEGKIVYAKDVRQVLTYVETGNVDAGIVYKTDALISSKVKIVSTADSNTHGPIIYPVGIIKNSDHLQEAELFYEYLQSEEAMNTFNKFGFSGLK